MCETYSVNNQEPIKSPSSCETTSDMQSLMAFSMMSARWLKKSLGSSPDQGTSATSCLSKTITIPFYVGPIHILKFVSTLFKLNTLLKTKMHLP